MCILLIESNNLTEAESLAPQLKPYGYQVHTAHSPEVAAETVKNHWPDLIVFNLTDSQLPLVNFRRIVDKIDLNIPYLVVGTTGQLPDETEIDIMPVSPDDPQQLTKAVESAIAQQSDRFIRLPDLIVDCHQHQILQSKKHHSLTPKEFKLLYLFLSNSDQVLSRKTIMQEVWDTDYMGDTRTLDVHIRWLREKIEENPSRPRRLITVRGVGYHFVTEIE